MRMLTGMKLNTATATIEMLRLQTYDDELY